MAFPEYFIEELRTRISLLEVVGHYVKLARRGREWVGLCPFHNEKTPSFTVNEDKGFYHCFGCQAHGSVFDFVMKREGISFPEAVETLSVRAGMEMPQISAQDEQKRKISAPLYSLMASAAEWFQKFLVEDQGQYARQYLVQRGLSGAAIRKFQVGYAPKKGSALKKALMDSNFSEKQLIDAGLLIRPDEGGTTFDRFRNRIIFPITDLRNRVVAFGGRALDESPAKYLNSPETPLFRKGHLLYNHFEAKPAVRDDGNVIVAEGYMDVIALSQAGIANVVAPLGTAVSEYQFALLWRLAPEPILCFDGDNAGWKAASRVAERILPHLKSGYSLRFVLLPDGEDPDSLIRKRGATVFKALLAEATPLSDLLWQMSVKDKDLSTPERRAGFAKNIRLLTQKITDRQVRSFYDLHYRARLEELFGATRLSSQLNSGKIAQSGFRRYKPRRLPRHHGLGPGKNGITNRRESVLMAAIINHPGLLELILEEFVEVNLNSRALDMLRNEIIDINANSLHLDREALKQQLLSRGYGSALADVTEAKVASLAPFVRAEVPMKIVEEGWRNTLLVHRLAVTLPAEKRAHVEQFDFTDEGFSRLKAFLGETERGIRVNAEITGQVPGGLL